MAGYHPMPALKAQGKVRHTLTSSERNMSVRKGYNTLRAASRLLGSTPAPSVRQTLWLRFPELAGGRNKPRSKAITADTRCCLVPAQLHICLACDVMVFVKSYSLFN